jgi:hypothetical protein
MSKVKSGWKGTVIDLDYLLLSLKTDNEVSIGPSEICNYISSEYNRRFPKHAGERGAGNGGAPPSYFYPRLQYKVIRGGPIIAAINEGCELLWSLYDHIDELNTAQSEWKVTEKRLIEKRTPFGMTRESIKYRFLTPWLALPEEMFKKYLAVDSKTQTRMLSKLLESHIRSIADSFNYPMDGELKLELKIKANYIFQREIHVAGLFGSFTANFEIPNFLGIGKSVSRGFGAVKRI